MSSDLTLVQASALASEVSLAKNYAVKSNNLVNSLTTDLQTLTTNVYVKDVSLNLVIANLTTMTLKLTALCALLATADISGVSTNDFGYNNLRWLSYNG